MIRSWLQDLKSPEISEFKDEMSNPYFRYVSYMILGWEKVKSLLKVL